MFAPRRREKSVLLVCRLPRAIAVTFFDISHGGFSYQADTRPDCEELIVAMQIHDQIIYVKARIINTREGDDKFVVGCKFGERFSVG